MSAATGIAVELDHAVAMPDGVTLATDVYRPQDGARHPAILVRTPYDKRAIPSTAHLIGFDALAAVRAGFAVVVQDCRGTAGSQGELRHFAHEAADGHAAVAWVAAQPWCDGAVGMTGASYSGAAQLLAATRRPDALRAIAPSITASEYYEGWTYQGGALQLGFVLMWATEMAWAGALRRGDARARERLEAILDDLAAAYARLPLAALPDEVPELAGSYGRWLEHPDRDEHWLATAVDERYGDIDVPALHVAGWHDLFLKGSLANYTGLRAGAGTAAARDGQRLIVSPWGHVLPNEHIGEVWLGRAGSPGLANLPAQTLAFLGGHLGGAPAPDGPRVRLFVMGANRWRDEDEWPLARAVPTRYHLRAGGLLAPQPGDDEPDAFAYDPADPVPTVGGSTYLPGGGFFAGPRDRRAVEARPDVLVYSSDVLEKDLEVTGPVTATLSVATSAPDTDFTVALVDVHPDGRALGVTDGILRLRYRLGTDRQVLAEPGAVYEIEVDLVATSMVFRAGHRLRVEVSSSNFPRFDRNPNHGGVIAHAGPGDLVVARQRVFHDGARPSFVTLPVVGR